MSIIPAKNKSPWIFILLAANLAFIYFYIFKVLLNYDLTWMVFEKLKTHLWILENGKDWHWSDFAKALNTRVIEIDPNRLTRPLSNLIEVIDAKFRANLWDYIPPHPCLSLQWPFLFIGLPFFLYKFFRNIDCNRVIALAGTSLYLTSSGFLSPLIMLSHPAKSMVNFFSILSLATFSQLYRSVKTRDFSIKNIPHFRWIISSCLLWTLISFLSDETGTFLFLILTIAALPIYFQVREKKIFLYCFAGLPIVYFMIIHFLLPWLHLIVNHETIELNHYRDYPHISSLFFPNWHDLFINAYLLFTVHPNLKWNFAPLIGHPFLISLQSVYTIAFTAFLGSFAYLIFKTKTLNLRLKQILAGLALLLLYIYFHTFQLSHNVRVWTIFWYGCLFSLIYYITLTLILQYLWDGFKGNTYKRMAPFLIIIFTIHGLMTSTYLIRMFKNQGNDPTVFFYPRIFSGEITPYSYFNLSESLKRSRCRYLYTLLYWSEIKNKTIDTVSTVKEIQSCSTIISADHFFQSDQVYFMIEAGFQFPAGHSFLNDPAFVSAVIRQQGEPPIN